MQRRKTGKISIFNSLDVIFDFMTSRVEHSNRVSTRDQYQIESECWNQVFESSQKIDIEYSNWVRRLISKLGSTISLVRNLIKRNIIVNNCNNLLTIFIIDDLINFKTFKLIKYKRSKLSLEQNFHKDSKRKQEVTSNMKSDCKFQWFFEFESRYHHDNVDEDEMKLLLLSREFKRSKFDKY